MPPPARSRDPKCTLPTRLPRGSAVICDQLQNPAGPEVLPIRLDPSLATGKGVTGRVPPCSLNFYAKTDEDANESAAAGGEPVLCS